VDAYSFSCVKRIKKDVDVTTIKFVNIKLGIPDQPYDSVFKKDFWPNSVKVKRFIHRERAIVVGDGILFNFTEPGQTSTSSHPSKNPSVRLKLRASIQLMVSRATLTAITTVNCNKCALHFGKLF